MTRWAMVADLERCVGCQTCTAACRHANATSPAVQWRKVLDIEAGSFPNVSRTYVPVGCQHCADPPCMHVCPSTATRQRTDGLVTIDYDICIGCAYCDVACPYQARFKIDAGRWPKTTAYVERVLAAESFQKLVPFEDAMMKNPPAKQREILAAMGAPLTAKTFGTATPRRGLMKI